jgi:hypothetical protein
MIEARAPIGHEPSQSCAGCAGTKGAPIAAVFSIYHQSIGFTIALCEECGRDVANAVGFMCIRDGGWSKLEPRKRKTTTKQNDERKER